MFGSWLDKVELRHVESGDVETLWQEPVMIPNAHMQYYFDHLAILMNYKNKQMEEIVCPTDCRFRNDLRCYEEGRIEESESEKNLIEKRQRKTRKQVEDGLI